MASKLDLLLIVDVEATCWGTSPPKGEHQEIIEIGLCTFDIATWTPVEKRSIVVRPSLSTVSKYCTDLTGWTQEALHVQGTTFFDACNILTDVYNSRRRVWASWGDFDRMQFERDCKRKAVNYPFGPTHFNLKTLFAIKNRLRKEVGMKTALDLASLNLIGRHHSGADDAWNIGGILADMEL